MIDYFNSKSKTWDQHQYRVERAEVVANSIRRLVPLFKIKTALDFGCGTGLLGLNLASSVSRITLADNSSGMLEQVERKIQEKSLKNASTLLLVDGNLNSSYDLIVSLMVLHHIEDAVAQIEILSDVTNSGGYLCLCDLEKEDGSFHQEEKVPHNGFERRDIELVLRRNGMEIVDSSIVYTNRKRVDDIERAYPVFMIVGNKKSSNILIHLTISSKLQVIRAFDGSCGCGQNQKSIVSGLWPREGKDRIFRFRREER